jgi:hypothetical protein
LLVVGASRRRAAPGSQFVVRFAYAGQPRISAHLRVGTSSLRGTWVHPRELPARSSCRAMKRSFWGFTQAPRPAVSNHCCLTLRSSRAPTAGHQGQPAGTVYIFCWLALASHRWCRLSSNVRQHHGGFVALRAVLETAQLRRPLRPQSGTALATPAKSSGHSRELERQASSMSAERVAIVAHGCEQPLRVSLSYRRRARIGAPSTQSRGGSRMTVRPGFIQFLHVFASLSWESAASARVSVEPVKTVLPNPSLKLSANGVAHWPSGAGASPQFCARCPVRHAVGASLARTLGITVATMWLLAA